MINSPKFELVVQRLSNELPALSAKVANLVHREQRSYLEVSDRELAMAVTRNMSMTTRALREQIYPHYRDGVEQAAETAQERYRAGIPMEEAMRAFALCIWSMHQRFLELCDEEGVPQHEVIAGSNTIWSLNDAVIAKVAATYHMLETQRVMDDAQRRGDFVRQLLKGQVSIAELSRTPLNMETDYAAVRCAATRDFPSGERRRLEASGGRPDAPAMLAVVGGEYVGIVSCAPKPSPRVLVAMGPMVPLEKIASSYDLTNRIFHVASHIGRSGVCRLIDLTWRIAAVGNTELTTLLREQLLDPIRTIGVFGKEVEAVIRSYLANNLSISRTANELNLHVNTVRYRLRRYTEFTGANLDDPADLFDVLWAFELSDMPERIRIP